MTNEQMAELLLKRAERIDATNASGMTADYVRELAEEAAAMRAGAKALLATSYIAPKLWVAKKNRMENDSVSFSKPEVEQMYLWACGRFAWPEGGEHD